MYIVKYFGVRGAEFSKEFDTIDQACLFALQKKYGFSYIEDKNGSIIYSSLQDYGNGVFVFHKKYTPY